MDSGNVSAQGSRGKCVGSGRTVCHQSATRRPSSGVDSDAGELFRQQPVAEWLQRCADADVPAGPVNSLDKVFDDPQTLSRGMRVEMPHPTAETVQLAGTPLNLSGTPTQMRMPPPLLGEHTNEILTNLLGLNDRAIADLRRDGVI